MFFIFLRKIIALNLTLSLRFNLQLQNRSPHTLNLPSGSSSFLARPRSSTTNPLSREPNREDGESGGQTARCKTSKVEPPHNKSTKQKTSSPLPLNEITQM
ncbi:hypothetical protein VPH35_086311 [Triticum aestivum]